MDDDELERWWRGRYGDGGPIPLSEPLRSYMRTPAVRVEELVIRMGRALRFPPDQPIPWCAERWLVALYGAVVTAWEDRALQSGRLRALLVSSFAELDAGDLVEIAAAMGWGDVVIRRVPVSEVTEELRVALAGKFEPRLRHLVGEAARLARSNRAA